MVALSTRQCSSLTFRLWWTKWRESDRQTGHPTENNYWDFWRRRQCLYVIMYLYVTVYWYLLYWRFLELEKILPLSHVVHYTTYSYLVLDLACAQTYFTNTSRWSHRFLFVHFGTVWPSYVGHFFTNTYVPRTENIPISTKRLLYLESERRETTGCFVKVRSISMKGEQ